MLPDDIIQMIFGYAPKELQLLFENAINNENDMQLQQCMTKWSHKFEFSIDEIISVNIIHEDWDQVNYILKNVGKPSYYILHYYQANTKFISLLIKYKYLTRNDMIRLLGVYCNMSPTNFDMLELLLKNGTSSDDLIEDKCVFNAILYGQNMKKIEWFIKHKFEIPFLSSPQLYAAFLNAASENNMLFLKWMVKQKYVTKIYNRDIGVLKRKKCDSKTLAFITSNVKCVKRTSNDTARAPN